MSSAAAEMMARCVFEGSLSMCDTDIERRPYHRDCKCALHNEKAKCSHSVSKQRNLSFPKRQFSSKCSLSVKASAESSYVHISSSRTAETIIDGSTYN